jgi:hypothetical protein
MLYAGRRKQLKRYDPGVSLKVTVTGEDSPATGDCDGAKEKIGSASGDAASSASIAPLSRFFVIVCGNRLVSESAEVCSQPVKLIGISNSRKEFLPDRSDEPHPAVLNEVAKVRRDSRFGFGYLRPGPSKSQGPNAGVDQNLH